MESIHIRKRSYEGYCVGVGVEYPGIIVSAQTDDELVEKFKAAIPSYKRALEKYGVEDTEEVVISIDAGQVANR